MHATLLIITIASGIFKQFFLKLKVENISQKLALQFELKHNLKIGLHLQPFMPDCSVPYKHLALVKS
jgi:hypothetical protein